MCVERPVITAPEVRLSPSQKIGFEIGWQVLAVIQHHRHGDPEDQQERQQPKNM